jgi:hypothetical protein
MGRNFNEGLPMSKGKDKIILVVDRLTKYAHFMAIKKTDSAKQTIEVFYKNVYKLHGFPKVIVSDRDTKFKGSF